MTKDPKTPIDSLADEQSTLRKAIADLSQAQSTCAADDKACILDLQKKVDTLVAKLEKIEDIVAAKAKDVVDGRLATVEAKLTEMASSHASLAKSLEKPAPPEISEDAGWQCKDCGSWLDMFKPACKKCGAEVDWHETLGEALADLDKTEE